MENFGFGFTFEELYTRDGLIKLDAVFVATLRKNDVALHNRLMAARATPKALSDKDHSQLLIDLAPMAEDFIGELFGVKKEMRTLAEKHHALTPIYACKRLFVQRRASKTLSPEEAGRVDGPSLLALLPMIGSDDPYFELVFSKVVMGWLEDEARHKSLLEVAGRYAAWALYSDAGRKKHGAGILFKQPRKIDAEHLVPVDTEIKNGVTAMRLTHTRHRDGFKLTDDAGHLANALDHAHYCIFCHHQGKDSCSKGFREKTGQFKRNALEISLHGCPLEEKISEMNELKSTGHAVGALAVVAIDNPMCAGTGHRICNDCMKSCIYQKQEPVNVPLVETHVLKDVLELPYGFEIYSLFTRWNPLNLERPIPKEESGKKVLVSGLGPAGYTLAHHLLNDGHTVVAVDGLKIEPLPSEISGVTALGVRTAFSAIKDISTLYEDLDKRAMAGFGGVAEYGITVRWNKNYLKVIRLLLERRDHFSMIGGARFGSQITYDSAFAMGFDHIALCLGAGAPALIDMPNGLARGVRMASDFLMGLQLTGAAKKDSLANLQLRLPAVVIGGGLTAIDTATEALAYYPVQVEKFLERYEALVAERGEQAVRMGWTPEESEIAEEFIAHARAIKSERDKARQENSSPNLLKLLASWGGVKIIYRKKLQDAPSYRLNHEEVEKALEEGVEFCENLEPVAVEVDEWGHTAGIKCQIANIRKENSDIHHPSPAIRLPARAILIAAGTKPNTVLAREDATHFMLDGKYFQAVDEEGERISPAYTPKPPHPYVLMSFDTKHRAVSFFGDLHPSFSGSVVKAMASAKQGYPVVSRVLAKRSLQSPVPSSQFITSVNAQLRATVHEVNRLTPTIVEVIIKAPLAAAIFQPGQFYRLQNFEFLAPKILETEDWRLETSFAMEGLAMTGAWVDKARGLVSVIILEMGGSSDLCAYLKPDNPVVLMGPTGAPTHIPKNQTVLLVGGGLGNAVLFSIGRAMRENGCRVLYFAGYRKAEDRYKAAEIEAAADIVVWCCDETELSKNRPQDFSFHGNIVEAMTAYAENKLGAAPISFKNIEHLMVIGSDKMMAAVATARFGALKGHLNPRHTAVASVNSPMQCMMKEICAQCLQKQVDPDGGKESYVYSCFNQDQCLDTISFPHLNERLKQNSVQEKLTAEWLDTCLKFLHWRHDTA